MSRGRNGAGAGFCTWHGPENFCPGRIYYSRISFSIVLYVELISFRGLLHTGSETVLGFAAALRKPILDKGVEKLRNEIFTVVCGGIAGCVCVWILRIILQGRTMRRFIGALLAVVSEGI